MQYSNRSSYENRNKRPFYSSRQYNNNKKYENSRYGNPRYKNLEYENSEKFNKMFIIRASQKVYFNEFSNKNMFYNIEKYYKNFYFYYFRENSDSHYFKDFFSII